MGYRSGSGETGSGGSSAVVVVTVGVSGYQSSGIGCAEATRTLLIGGVLLVLQRQKGAVGLH